MSKSNNFFQIKNFFNNSQSNRGAPQRYHHYGRHSNYDNRGGDRYRDRDYKQNKEHKMTDNFQVTHFSMFKHITFTFDLVEGIYPLLLQYIFKLSKNEK